MDIPITSSGKESAAASPRKGRMERLLNSPLLLVVLLLATATLGVKWYALKASLEAPVLLGWDWSKHPNALLVYYPHTDCGCGPGVSSVLAQAITHHLDVVVVSDIQGEKLNLLKTEVSNSQASLLTPNALINTSKFHSSGNIVSLRIRKGYISGRAQGTNIPDSFF